MRRRPMSDAAVEVGAAGVKGEVSGKGSYQWSSTSSEAGQIQSKGLRSDFHQAYFRSSILLDLFLLLNRKG